MTLTLTTTLQRFTHRINHATKLLWTIFVVELFLLAIIVTIQAIPFTAWILAIGVIVAVHHLSKETNQ